MLKSIAGSLGTNLAHANNVDLFSQLIIERFLVIGQVLQILSTFSCSGTSSTANSQGYSLTCTIFLTDLSIETHIGLGAYLEDFADDFIEWSTKKTT